MTNGVTDYTVEPDTYPPYLLEQDRWFAWKYDDGRKIPRAPWSDGNVNNYVSWKDESVWTNFETVKEWADHGMGFRYATCIPDKKPHQTRLVLFDFDDCRNPDTKTIHPQAWEFIQTHGLHAAVSTSGTGLHGYALTRIPEGRKPSFNIPMDDWDGVDGEPELEVYANARFVAVTGNHIAETPVELPEVHDVFADMADEHGRRVTEAESHDPEQSRDQIQRKNKTSDIGDIYDAIEHTRPADIRLQSSVTTKRADGTKSLDPSWEQSESGTRLAEIGDHWLYRKGNHRLDALQVVALEERIITDASDYPTGEDFWTAVEALRDRGAHIPQYVNSQQDRQANRRVEAPDPEPDTDGGDADYSEEWMNVDKWYNDALSDDGGQLERQRARHAAADLLAQSGEYRTHDVSGHIYAYDSDAGIFRNQGENRLRETLVERLGDHYSKQEVREIKSIVESKTFTDEFKTPTGKVCVGNGVLDVGNDELEPHSPGDEFLARVAVEYDPDAECPLFREFIADILTSDADRKKIQEFAGYCLMHWGLPHHKALFLVGPQSSGKSTLLDTLSALFSGSARTSLTPQEMTGERFRAHKLHGAWVNIRNDIDDKMIQNVGKFKEIIAGDSILAERKHEQPYEFNPTAKHIFASNKLPDASVDDDAFYRRILLASAPRTVPRDKRDPKLGAKLQDELSGVLNWALDGLRRLQDQGHFTGDLPPDATRDKWEAWGSSAKRFKADAVELQGDATLTKQRAYRAYQEFCEAKGLPSVSKRKLTQTLTSDKDIQNSKTTRDGKTVRCYTGCRLVAEWEPSDRDSGDDDPDRVGLGGFDGE